MPVIIAIVVALLSGFALFKFEIAPFRGVKLDGVRDYFEPKIKTHNIGNTNLQKSGEGCQIFVDRDTGKEVNRYCWRTECRNVKEYSTLYPNTQVHVNQCETKTLIK